MFELYLDVFNSDVQRRRGEGVILAPEGEAEGSGSIRLAMRSRWHSIEFFSQLSFHQIISFSFLEC